MIRSLRIATGVAVTVLWATALSAQVPSDSAARRQRRTLDSLAAALRVLQARIDSLVRARAGGDTTVTDELAALRAAAATTDSAALGAQPQQARLGQNALNPEISVSGDLRATARQPGPQKNSFEAREFEVGFQSALDPFATAKVFASFADGAAAVEEGYLFFPALPGGFRLDVGRFRQEIGELNRWHLHAVTADEYPLVIRRYGSNDGVSGTGVSLYRALPFSGRAGTYELTLQATTGDNEVLYAGGSRPSATGKLAAFWQLSRATYLMTSVTGAYGTNPDTGLTTRLVVAAARFTWRPPQRSQERELTLRGELWTLLRRFSGTGPTRRGWYADGSWKLNRRFIVGVRYDRVQSPDTLASEWAITPALTYWQSEFVYLRALWEHARDVTGANRDRFTIRTVFAMGPHKHELF